MRALSVMNDMNKQVTLGPYVCDKEEQTNTFINKPTHESSSIVWNDQRVNERYSCIQWADMENRMHLRECACRYESRHMRRRGAAHSCGKTVEERPIVVMRLWDEVVGWRLVPRRDRMRSARTQRRQQSWSGLILLPYSHSSTGRYRWRSQRGKIIVWPQLSPSQKTSVSPPLALSMLPLQLQRETIFPSVTHAFSGWSSRVVNPMCENGSRILWRLKIKRTMIYCTT